MTFLAMVGRTATSRTEKSEKETPTDETNDKGDSAAAARRSIDTPVRLPELQSGRQRRRYELETPEDGRAEPDKQRYCSIAATRQIGEPTVECQ